MPVIKFTSAKSAKFAVRAALVAGLVNQGFATLTHEKIRAGGKLVEVAMVRITEKGRDALRGS